MRVRGSKGNLAEQEVRIPRQYVLKEMDALNMTEVERGKALREVLSDTYLTPILHLSDTGLTPAWPGEAEKRRKEIEATYLTPI